MAVDSDTFYSESPRRLLHRAELHARDIEHNTQLHDHTKLQHLKDLADRRKDDVRCAIDINHQQNNLFRKLQEQDQHRRRSLLDKIEKKVDKVNTQRHDFYRKRSVDMHKVNEKVEKKLEKHQTDVHRFDEKCGQQARTLTKEMLEFHKKQMEAEQKEWKRLRNLKTCYKKADQTINHREHQKELFALKSKEELDKELQRNCKKQNPEFAESVSRRHKRVRYSSIQLSEAFNTSNDFYHGRFERFIQTYCSDLDTAIDMQAKKQTDFNQTKERIGKFLTKRVEKWSKLKKRADEEAVAVADKCTNRMVAHYVIQNKSLNSSFRLTMTSMDFHKTANTWRTRNDQNKHHLKELQTQRDNSILKKHLDTTMQNRDSDTLNNTMTDLSKHAGFQAREFL